MTMRDGLVSVGEGKVDGYKTSRSRSHFLCVRICRIKDRLCASEHKTLGSQFQEHIALSHGGVWRRNRDRTVLVRIGDWCRE